ncbi:MAG: hypothetical protein ACAI35_23000, partial [Candidatus Methylacidiphilales bacterium]
STVLTLFVVPCAYSLLAAFERPMSEEERLEHEQGESHASGGTPHPEPLSEPQVEVTSEVVAKEELVAERPAEIQDTAAASAPLSAISDAKLEKPESISESASTPALPTGSASVSPASTLALLAAPPPPLALPESPGAVVPKLPAPPILPALPAPIPSPAPGPAPVPSASGIRAASTPIQPEPRPASSKPAAAVPQSPRPKPPAGKPRAPWLEAALERERLLEEEKEKARKNDSSEN